jgi:hypothetical protein
MRWFRRTNCRVDRGISDGFRRQSQLRNNLECPAEEAPETISLAVRQSDETYASRPPVCQFLPHENWGSPESQLIGLS